MTNIGKALRDKHFKQKQIADAIGVSQGNVSEWVRGRCLPSGGNLMQLADILGVSTDYLLGREPSESPAEAFLRELPELSPDEWLELRRYAAYLVSLRPQKF